MATHPDVGDPAPDFRLSSTDGEFQLSKRLEEGAVLLVFYPKEDTLVFAARYRLPFTLCADADRKVSRVYGALPYVWNARRALVLVGEDQRVWWRHKELRLFRRDAEELLQVIRELRATR